MAFDAADHIKAGGTVDELLAGAARIGTLADRHATDLVVARQAIKTAMLTLGAAQTTASERNSVAMALGGAIDALSWLAALAPQEWERACLAMSNVGGFASKVTALRKVMREQVAANEGECCAEEEREQAAERARAGVGDRHNIRDRLSTTATGKVNACYANLVTILKNDPYWSSLRMSALGDVVELGGQELNEAPATASACEWLRDSYCIDANEVAVTSAIYAVAQARRYSPVRDYLMRVRGRTGTDTINRLLPDVLGIPDATELHRAMLGRFLVGAVARAMKPGCKMDTALVLVGRQGAKKSTFFDVLFGDWFGDSPIPIGNKDAPIQLSRVWGYEASELEDLTSKRTAEAVKSFMATRRDLFRAPFARTAKLYPRHTVLCGTTNRLTFLTDESGSRRFWILTIPDEWVIDRAKIEPLRDAVWSEAVGLYGDGSGDGVNGEPWWFERAQDDVREEDSQQYVEEDPWQARISKWLEEDAVGILGNFKTSEVMAAIGLDAANCTRANAGRVRSILIRLNWRELSSPAGFRGMRLWRRK